MKRIYIAGPMTGLPDLNAKEFLKAELEFHWGGSFEFVYNPAAMANHFCWNENTDVKTIAKILLEALTRCTHIYMLRGWKESKGATAEHAVAKWIGLEIIYQEGAE